MRYQEDSAQCIAFDTGCYGRAVARCSVQRLDIGAVLVGAGVATAYRDYFTDYVVTEAAAKVQRLGIWVDTMQEPAAYRDRYQDSAPGDCAIKGSFSDNGQIYHSPACHSYPGT